MEKQYTSKQAKRIMEIGKEVQQIMDEGKGTPVIIKIIALNEELVILAAS